jgi:ABC-2 type transport system permease protein
MQLELAGICFGISAFLRKGSIGVGLGVAIIAYFMNLIANITESASFLKNITPFGYCDAAEIASSGGLDAARIAIGAVIAVVCVLGAFAVYTRKDIK